MYPWRLFRPISDVYRRQTWSEKFGCALFVLFGTFSAGVKSAEPSTQTIATSLALLVTGDDGVTQELVADMRSQIAASHDLVITDDVASVVRMQIPTNVEVAQSRGEYRVYYTVLFLDKDSKYLGGSFGSCMESKIHECAADVIHDLRVTIRYLPDNVGRDR